MISVVLARWAQGSVAVFGLLYTAGILIVNIELARYGLAALSLTQPEYVMAGGLWLSLTILSAASIHFGVVAIRTAHAERNSHTLVYYFGGVLRGLFFMFGPITLYVTLLNHLTRDPIFWIVVGVVAVTLNGGVAYYVTTTAVNLRKTYDPTKWTRYGIGVLGWGVMIIWALTMFATAMYPRVPKYFGGGRKPLVFVFLTQSPGIDWKMLQYPIKKDVLGPVELILERPDQVFVQPRTLIPVGQDRHLFSKLPTVAIERRFVSMLAFIASEDEGLLIYKGLSEPGDSKR